MWGLILLIGGIKYQTDWMGGAGIQGPVTLWGTKYYTGDSITIATPGQVSLKATHWNYGNWTRHIVEQNSDIPCHVQGTMPADIDKDGITDLVAHTGQEVVWYKHDGLYNFSKRIIGPASRNGICSPCVYPCDLDQDGDIDVLVATDGVGLGWYENIGTQENWPWHLINNAYGYHRVSSADIELDGDLDIIAVNNWPQTPVNTRYYKGDIYIFRNNGDGTFATPTMIDLPLYEGWRVYTADFNKDGYPDIYTSLYTVYVFMNDGAG
ncbi:MAG: VCBS repeat-containing protein, partial [Candidatus Stahlbacteria bacterium]|nr:VCBS repeat-containing protein [Candidatus Stahlbacteria bacterium]